MLARIKQDARYATLRLFCGREYSKNDWNEVPAGFEKQATENDALEIRGEQVVEIVVEAETPIAVVEVAPPAGVEPAPMTDAVIEPALTAAPAGESRVQNHNRRGGK